MMMNHRAMAHQFMVLKPIVIIKPINEPINSWAMASPSRHPCHDPASINLINSSSLRWRPCTWQGKSHGAQGVPNKGSYDRPRCWVRPTSYAIFGHKTIVRTLVVTMVSEKWPCPSLNFCLFGASVSKTIGTSFTLLDHRPLTAHLSRKKVRPSQPNFMVGVIFT